MGTKDGKAHYTRLSYEPSELLWQSPRREGGAWRVGAGNEQPYPNPCPPVWGTKLQKMLSVKVMQHPQGFKSGNSFFAPSPSRTALQAWPFDLTQDIRHACWMSCSTSRSHPLQPTTAGSYYYSWSACYHLRGFELKWLSPGNSSSPHLHSPCSSSVEWRSLKKKRCSGQSYLLSLTQPSLFLHSTNAPSLCQWQPYSMYQPLISDVHVYLMACDCCSYAGLRLKQPLQNAVCRGGYF